MSREDTTAVAKEVDGMSLVEREVTPRQVAANQSNSQKSTGPKTPEGKARVSLNALKTGAYAKGDNALRQILLKRGESPQEHEQLHRDLMDSWQPDDTMQALLVKTIADKTWDKLQLRAAWLESQLTALQVAQIQAERRQLLSRRWLPGVQAAPDDRPGLWRAKDSPKKFHDIHQFLDCLQEWFEKVECPVEYPQLMAALYGDTPSLAGERIRQLFIQFFGDDQALSEKAGQEVPKWIARERRDVQEEEELYRRESALRAQGGPNLTEEQVAAKETALERQIAEQARLLLQMKSKRSLWPSQPEAGEGAAGSGTAARSGEKQTGTQGDEGAAVGAVVAENAQKGQTKPSGTAESTT